MSSNHQLQFGSALSGAERLTGCAVIAVALVMATSGPASATVKLINATYVYTIVNGNGAAIEDLPRPMTKAVVGEPLQIPFNGGTVTGSYSLFAANSRDDVQASIQIEAAPNNLVNSGTIYLTAESQYQVAAVVKSGRKPPTSVKAVPIEITITGSVSCSNSDSSATASFSFGLLAPLSPSNAACNDSQFSDRPAFAYSTKESLPIGAPDTFDKTVTALANNFSAINGATASLSVHATVDPTIEIDPSFAYADDFELEYSPGYASGGAAPEPETWAMVGIGFLALGIVGPAMMKRTAGIPTPSQKPGPRGS
jgi:hypothetical protein